MAERTPADLSAWDTQAKATKPLGLAIASLDLKRPCSQARRSAMSGKRNEDGGEPHL
jgi:hypothetical protein